MLEIKVCQNFFDCCKLEFSFYYGRKYLDAQTETFSILIIKNNNNKEKKRERERERKKEMLYFVINNEIFV